MHHLHLQRANTSAGLGKPACISVSPAEVSISPSSVKHIPTCIPSAMLHILMSREIKYKYVKYTSQEHSSVLQDNIKSISSSPLLPLALSKRQKKIQESAVKLQLCSAVLPVWELHELQKKKTNMVGTGHQMRLDTFQSTPDTTFVCLGIDPPFLKNTALRASSGT